MNDSTIWVSIKCYVRESFATSIVFDCIMEFIEICEDERKTMCARVGITLFVSLVGRNHPSIWTLLQSLQQDQVLAATDMLQDARGQPLNKRCKRSTEQHEQRLYRLCCDRRDDKKSVPQTLQALDHCIRLVR